MGSINTITANQFPRQRDDLHKKVRVCFNYDTSQMVMGTIIRDDMEHPFRTIIELDDGRVVLSVECQYNIYS